MLVHSNQCVLYRFLTLSENICSRYSLKYPTKLLLIRTFNLCFLGVIRKEYIRVYISPISSSEI